MIHAVVRMVASCIQFQRGPSSSVYSRQPRNSGDQRDAEVVAAS